MSSVMETEDPTPGAPSSESSRAGGGLSSVSRDRPHARQGFVGEPRTLLAHQAQVPTARDGRAQNEERKPTERFWDAQGRGAASEWGFRKIMHLGFFIGTRAYQLATYNFPEITLLNQITILFFDFQPSSSKL